MKRSLAPTRCNTSTTLRLAAIAALVANTVTAAVAREMIARKRERATLEALEDLVRYMRVVREERKAVVTVTEGWLLYGENRDLVRRRTDPVTGRPIGEPWKAHEGAIWGAAAAMVDGWPVAVTGSNDKTVRVWDLTGLAAPVRVEHHPVTGPATARRTTAGCSRRRDSRRR